MDESRQTDRFLPTRGIPLGVFTQDSAEPALPGRQHRHLGGDATGGAGGAQSGVQP